MNNLDLARNNKPVALADLAMKHFGEMVDSTQHFEAQKTIPSGENFSLEALANCSRGVLLVGSDYEDVTCDMLASELFTGVFGSSKKFALVSGNLSKKTVTKWYSRVAEIDSSKIESNLLSVDETARIRNHAQPLIENTIDSNFVTGGRDFSAIKEVLEAGDYDVLYAEALSLPAEPSEMMRQLEYLSMRYDVKIILTLDLQTLRRIKRESVLAYSSYSLEVTSDNLIAEAQFVKGDKSLAGYVGLRDTKTHLVSF